MKQNGVTDDALCLYLFPYLLTHHATAWFDRLPKNSIHTFQEMASKFLSKYFPPSMMAKLRNDITGGTFMKRRPEECYDLIENMTAHHNDWDTSAHRDMIQMYRSNQQVNSVTPSCETCGGPHSYYECQVAGGYTQDVYATTGNYNSGGNTYQPQGNRNLLGYRSNNFLGPPSFNPPNNQNQGQLTKPLQKRPQGALPSNTVPNPRKQIDLITTRSGLTTAKPSILPPPTSTAHVPPLGIQPVSPPKPKEDSKPNPHQPKIPYPPSLMDALTQILKYHKVLKDLLKDKEKLEELANTLINAECSSILLNKVPKKLGDPKKFLIPCILQDLEVCNSLADSRASINLMPLSIYEKLGIGSLKPTRMTLEMAKRSVALPKGIAQDVIVRVDKFNFLADFIVVDFEADPRVPIIFGRPFLRTAKALVDLYEEKLTLRVRNEQVVFYTDKSSRNNSRDNQSVHCINIIDFLKDKPISGSTTLSSDSLPGSSFPSSPLVETSDSLLEKFADELALLDPFPPRNEDDNFDPEADLKEIEYLLNQDPSADSSPATDIDIIDPILERFTDEPALIYSSPPGDDDDDLFDLKSDNEEWKKLLYGDLFDNTHSENEKDKDLKIESLIDDMDYDLFDLKSDNDEWKKLLYGDHFNDIHSEKDKMKDSKTKILINELESLESPESNCFYFLSYH
ncbi:reverse transcriptase domain-containing protein [Tanacetum coccineum]